MTRHVKRKARRYPALPSEVQGAGGTIDICLVPHIAGAVDEDVMGQFHPAERRIDIRRGLRGDQQWLVYYHELVHAALWDSGAANALRDPVEEIVCDALATARLRERFG